MKRKCSSLREDEQVVFRIDSDILEKKIPMNGSVLFVDLEAKRVLVSWLEGYKDRKDFVPFEDMLAVYNPDGEMLKFDNISGNSDRLSPD